MGSDSARQEHSVMVFSLKSPLMLAYFGVSWIIGNYAQAAILGRN